MDEFDFIPVEDARRITGHESYSRFRWWIWHHNKKHGETLPIYRRRGKVDRISLSHALKNLNTVMGSRH